MDEDVSTLRRMAVDFTEGFNSGDLDRIMQYYGDSYVDVNLRSPVQSHDERRVYYAKLITSGLRVRVVPDEIKVHGDFGLVRGTISVAGANGESKQLRYLEVLTKDRDGKWKSMWGMDGPIQEYDPRR